MFQRNLGSKERVVRVVGGGVMMLCGVVGLGATPLGLGIAALGVGSLVSGMIRYCPACALAGRKPVETR